MNIKTIITTTLLMVSCSAFAQQSQQARQMSQPQQADDAQRAKYKQEIGLDMSVPDYQTKSINPKVMGPRLAGILNFILKNYQQSVYNNRISLILSEQNDALEYSYLRIRKMKFVSAVKKTDELTVVIRVWLDKNSANVKQTDIIMSFDDGVSDSQNVNELFCNANKYVQAREELAVMSADRVIKK